MTLSAGLTYLAIPGPSVMPERVLRAMHRAAPNIYYGELPDMVPGIVSRLKTVARTEAHVAMYIANGHGAWEAAVANVFSPGDLVLVPATGRFAHGWAEIARMMGVETEIIDFGKRATIDLEQVKDAGLTEEEVKAYQPKKGAGCSNCSDTGYKGRVAIYEVMVMTDSLKEFVLNGASGAEIKREAIRGGMVTLRRSALNKMLEGVTTVSEVYRVSTSDSV